MVKDEDKANVRLNLMLKSRLRVKYRDQNGKFSRLC